MFFEVLFFFIFYARAIKPFLTIESFVSVFSKLKLNYKYLIGLFIPMLAGFSMCVSVLEKHPFPC